MRWFFDRFNSFSADVGHKGQHLAKKSLFDRCLEHDEAAIIHDFLIGGRDPIAGHAESIIF